MLICCPIDLSHPIVINCTFYIPEQPRLSKIDEVELALALLAADHKIFGFDVSVQLAFTVQTFYPIHHLNCKHYNGFHGKLAYCWGKGVKLLPQYLYSFSRLGPNKFMIKML